ncbi:hypothetical protein CPB85DRAFT_1439843 [Mucidula mucida]|nr:hypothetical protein CPB85DRAFT_1439843 [Mucidula mucida]
MPAHSFVDPPSDWLQGFLHDQGTDDVQALLEGLVQDNPPVQSPSLFGEPDGFDVVHDEFIKHTLHLLSAQTSSVTGDLAVPASLDGFSQSHVMELKWDDYRDPLDGSQETSWSPTETVASAATHTSLESPSHSPAATSVYGAGGIEQYFSDNPTTATNVEHATPSNVFCLKCRDQKNAKGTSFVGMHDLLEHILAKHFNM